MEQKQVVVACLVGWLLTMAVSLSFAAEKTVMFTSVEDKGVISIYPNSFPVEKVLKGKVKGFDKEEIQSLGLTVEVSINDTLQGSVPVEKNGKWEVRVTIDTADLLLKSTVKDKDGNEIVATAIQATASGEF